MWSVSCGSVTYIKLQFQLKVIIKFVPLPPTLPQPLSQHDVNLLTVFANNICYNNLQMGSDAFWIYFLVLFCYFSSPHTSSIIFRDVLFISSLRSRKNKFRISWWKLSVFNIWMGLENILETKTHVCFNSCTGL